MKIKLLKKVRKRYVIQYYPKEINFLNETFRGQCMVFFDNNDNYRLSGVEICTPDKYQNYFHKHKPTKEEAKAYLIEYLMEYIRKDYRYAKKRKSKQIIENVWYNPISTK